MTNEIEGMNSLILDQGTKTIVTESSKMLFQKIISRIKEIVKGEENYSLIKESLIEDFGLYITNNYKKYESIPTIALRDRKVTLSSIYQPLTIINKLDKSDYKITEYCNDIFNNHSKMMIVDSAGMGKSTLSQYLFLSALEKPYGIPVFIELRSLKDGKTIINEIYNKFNFFKENLKKEHLVSLIQEGDFIFFFDGYDEIANTDKERVTQDLRNFIANAGNNKFILTSRPVKSANFPDFDKFEIKGIEKKEAFELIKKYDIASKLNIYDSLVDSIEEHSEDYLELLSNPLYVSLLYLTYKRKRELPLKQSEFYKQVFEALYMEHDLTKDGIYKRSKDSGLSMDELTKFLGRFAYVCLLKNMNDFNGDQIKNLIGDTLDKLYFKNNIEPSLLFNDLTENVPLFVRHGTDYKWIHKSFMEYFASLYISVHNKKTEILEYIRASEEIENYDNMLHIYSDIDKENFDQIFIKPYLKEYIDYMDGWNDSIKAKAQSKSLLFGQTLMTTRVTQAELNQYALELEKDDEIKSIEFINNRDIKEQKKLMDERETLIHRAFTLKMLENEDKNKNDENKYFKMTFSRKIDDGIFYQNCYINPLINLLYKISFNKGYEFVYSIVDDLYHQRNSFFENQNVIGVINSLDYSLNKNLYFDYKNTDTLIGRNVEIDILLLLPTFNRTNYVIDYDIAKKYYKKLDEKEERISDVVSLLI